MHDLPARFWEKLDKGSECWIWRAARNRCGYGTFKMSGVSCLAHRVAFEHLTGPIQPGLTIDHLCRNRACCNPAHLEAVPHRVNVLRGDGWAGKHFRQTHCSRGHLLGGENLRIQRDGGRRCKTCVRENRQRYRLERAAA